MILNMLETLLILSSGRWDVETFVFSYFMIGLVPCLFVGWKIAKKTKWYHPNEVDLQGEAKEIDEVKMTQL